MKQTLRRSILVLMISAAVAAQTTTRRATNMPALLAFPGFYHGRTILVVGNVALSQNGQLRVSDESGSGSIPVVFKGTGTAPDGLDEVRGEFWDLGRMKPDEPRL